LNLEISNALQLTDEMKEMGLKVLFGQKKNKKGREKRGDSALFFNISYEFVFFSFYFVK